MAASRMRIDPVPLETRDGRSEFHHLCGETVSLILAFAWSAFSANLIMA
jgi:hypothetical protein